MHFLREWLKISDFEYGNHHSTLRKLEGHCTYRGGKRVKTHARWQIAVQNRCNICLCYSGE